MVCPACNNGLASPRLIMMADDRHGPPAEVRCWECPNCGMLRRAFSGDVSAPLWEKGWEDGTAVSLRAAAFGTTKKTSAGSPARSFLSGAAISAALEWGLGDRDLSILLHDLAEEYLQRSVR